MVFLFQKMNNAAVCTQNIIFHLALLKEDTGRNFKVLIPKEEK